MYLLGSPTRGKVDHDLVELLVGVDTFVEIELWANEKLV